MIKFVVLSIALAMCACSNPGPVEFAGPPADAPTWQLNVGHPDIINGDLIREPTWMGK